MRYLVYSLGYVLRQSNNHLTGEVAVGAGSQVDLNAEGSTIDVVAHKKRQVTDSDFGLLVWPLRSVV